MRILLTFLLITSVGFTLYGQNVIQVTEGNNQIRAAYTTAQEGDIIELITDGGLYQEDSVLVVTFPITIRAAEGLNTKPVWQTSDSTNDHNLDVGASVWLTGFKMSGEYDDGVTDVLDSTRYAMRSADEVDSGYVIICEDMEFDHFLKWEGEEYGGYVYRADAPAEYAEEISFKNCMFTNIGKYAFRFREPTVAPGQFGKLVFENCTAADIVSYFIRAELLPSETDSAQVIVNHCTFYDIGSDVFRVDDGTDITLTNSIFVETNEVIDAPDATVTYCDTMNTGGFNIDNANAVVENIYAEDPEFADPANYDFTVSTFFKGIAVGSDGQVVGDLRWDPDYQGTGVIQVQEGINNIQSAYDLAKAGDILELVTDGGLYQEETVLVTSFPITIRAADGLTLKPVWQTSDMSDDHILDVGASVWLKGFKMSGEFDDGVTDVLDSTRYAMRSADEVANGYVIMCEDMEFDHFLKWEGEEYGGYVYRADAPAEYAEEISFKNCMFTNIGKYAFRFREPTVAPGQFGKLVFENCTAADIVSYFIRAELLPSETDSAQVIVNHCTFYDIGSDVFRVDDGTDITLTNSIFVETNEVIDAPDATVTYCDTMNTGGFNIDNANAVVENIYAEDPEFADPANYDFTVSTFFKGIAVGSDGQVVGDLRWDPDYQGTGVIQVQEGINNIQSAYDLAKAGDILELVTDGGLYQEETVLVTSFPITIRAADGLTLKPVWQTSDMSDDHILDVGASVWLKGFKMSGEFDDGVTDVLDSTRYAMRSADEVANGYVIMCEDMEFDHFLKWEGEEYGGYVYRADAPAEYAEEISFKNCMFTNIGKYAFRFREPTVAPGQFGKLVFENCTAADIVSYFIRAELLPSETDSAQVIVNHCTFYDIGSDVFRVDDGTDITLTNSIFVETNEVIDAPDATVTYCDTMNTGGFKIDNANAVVENIYAEDPEFADPANYDFTVSTFFAGIAIGSDGEVVGDLRWKPIIDAIENDPNLPTVFALSQNYPNPFNPTTKIAYQLPKAVDVKLTIYNVLGQEIIRLVDENQKPGKYELLWDGHGTNGKLISSGIYFFRLKAGDFVKTHKMTFIK